MVRSTNDKSWFLKNSAAALDERITMVLMAPSLSKTTSPYLCLSSVRDRCGIAPRSNRLPNIGHPGGPGGRGPWRPELFRGRRRKRRRRRSRAVVKYMIMSNARNVIQERYMHVGMQENVDHVCIYLAS